MVTNKGHRLICTIAYPNKTRSLGYFIGDENDGTLRKVYFEVGECGYPECFDILSYPEIEAFVNRKSKSFVLYKPGENVPNKQLLFSTMGKKTLKKFLDSLTIHAIPLLRKVNKDHKHHSEVKERLIQLLFIEKYGDMDLGDVMPIIKHQAKEEIQKENDAQEVKVVAEIKKKSKKHKKKKDEVKE